MDDSYRTQELEEPPNTGPTTWWEKFRAKYPDMFDNISTTREGVVDCALLGYRAIRILMIGVLFIVLWPITPMYMFGKSKKTSSDSDKEGFVAGGITLLVGVPILYYYAWQLLMSPS